MVCVVPFLNERHHLGVFLDSMAAQHRRPDELLLVDDGSTDDSPALAEEFAQRHPRVRLLRRPRRVPVHDRLADAAELRAFQWGVTQASEPWDVVVKMDADLLLSPDLFATLEQAFLTRPDLGIAGAHLSLVDPATGELRRERCPSEHVRGATKFYRRACYEEIGPVPAILGWDTIDEVAARRCGWRTGSVDCASGDTIHMRPVGSYHGLVRAQFRWGACAYGIGQHPAWVAFSALRRLAARPPLLASLAFASGWLIAFARRRPRAAAEVRAFGRREQLSALRRGARSLSRGSRAARRAVGLDVEPIGGS